MAADDEQEDARLLDIPAAKVEGVLSKVTCDGKPVASDGELRLYLESKRPGDSIRVTLYRGKTKLQKTVVLVEAPQQRVRSKI